MTKAKTLIEETKRLRAEATQGAWKPELTEDYSSDDYDAMRPTGWIENVVEYEGCGTHRAKWEKGNIDFVIHAANNTEKLARMLEVALEGHAEVIRNSTDILAKKNSSWILEQIEAIAEWK